MSQTVEDRIQELPAQPRPALLALWRELFKGPPPTQVRKEVLVKFLAYRMQEQAYGGLSPAARKRLSELARQLENDPKAALSVGEAFWKQLRQPVDKLGQIPLAGPL